MKVHKTNSKSTDILTIVIFGILFLPFSIFQTYNQYTNYTFTGNFFIKKLITKFKDIQDATLQSQVTSLFIGTLLELEKSPQYNSFADEIKQKMFAGNPFIDFKLKMHRKIGILIGVMTEPVILIAKLSNGTHLSTILWSGVTEEISNFLSSSASRGISVEGSPKITYKNGFLFEVALDVLIFIAVLLYFTIKR